MRSLEVTISSSPACGNPEYLEACYLPNGNARTTKGSTVKVVGEIKMPEAVDYFRTAPTSCAVCAIILWLFAAPVDENPEISLGKVASLFEGDCPHVEYFKNLKYRFYPRSVPDYEKRELSVFRFWYRSCIFFECKYKAEKSDDFSLSAPMELVFKEKIPGHPGRILILDPQWIDHETVQGWISSCDEYHGKRCKILPFFEEEDRIQPLYFIDTLQNCLVQGSKIITEYVALSYTWGKTEILRNTLTLCQQLLRPGIFTSEELAGQIPRTIRDSFAVVRCLGQRYLWVDALCIVQDDADHLSLELSQMHRIYACASFTIIAVDGVDANYGLRGFRDLTCPRTLTQKQEPFQLAASEQIMKDIRSQREWDCERWPIPSDYHNRAWTFQETLFSKRQLLFENGSVRWRCQCSKWYEELIPDDRIIDHLSDLTDKWFHISIPTLSTLSEIIQRYNRRKFTFPEDGFSAFAGIQTMLHRTYPSGLIYGHPELFFDIAINWHPIEPVTRRIGSAMSRLGKVSGPLPSWSWLGWAGEIVFPYDQEFVIPHFSSVIDIEGYSMPVASWYVMESPTSTDRRRINSSWHNYNILAQDNAVTLPSGWRQEEYDFETIIHISNEISRHRFPRNIPKYCYKHSTFRKEEEVRWYPVPTLEPHSNHLLQPQTDFLFAQTSRAFLFADKLFELGENLKGLLYEPGSARERDEPLWVQLIDRRSQFVGILELHNEDDMAEFEVDAYAPRGRLVELVATCKGYTGRIYDIELAKALAKESGKESDVESWTPQLKDCYFALWIEWKDGVAYRRGSGVVTVEAWETEMEEELVDLILG